MTSTEQLLEREAKMGSELGRSFHYLWQNCAFACQLFSDYKTLYGCAMSRVALMNEVAPSFFRNMQLALAHDLLLRICRMTDPVGVGQKQNLTIQRLPLLVRSEYRAELTDVVAEALQKADFARPFRNRRLAHADLDSATERKGVVPPFAGDLTDLASAILSVGSVLDRVDRLYCGGSTCWELDENASQAREVLFLLREGINYKRFLREEITAGRMDVTARKRDAI